MKTSMERNTENVNCLRPVIRLALNVLVHEARFNVNQEGEYVWEIEDPEGGEGWVLSVTGIKKFWSDYELRENKSGD